MAEAVAGLTGQEQALWQAWIDGRHAEDRVRLFEHYAPWMRLVAGRLARTRPQLAEWGDCHALASEGLLQAIDRYLPREGARFQSYAEYYVRGAVLRGLAKFRQERPVDTAFERIAHRMPSGCAPLSVESLMDAAVDLAFGYFLEAGIADESLPRQQDPYVRHEQRQRVDLLHRSLAQLPEREAAILRLHYHDHLTFAQIAELNGISKTRVLQLHAGALARLRARFGED